MADKSVAVQVRGMNELRAALKAMDGNLSKQLSLQLYGIAKTIASTIRGAMPSASGWAQSTVIPHRKASGASISEGTGNPSEDYVPWLDFGGTTGRGHRHSTSGKGIGGGVIRREWLGRPVGEGRYIYPMIRAAWPNTKNAIDQAIAEVAQAAGFETSGHI